MLTVAAARLEAEHANPKLVADLREAAGFKAGKRARFQIASPEETKRIEGQRALFNVIPDCAAFTRLKTTMLQRAYDLLWDGDCAGCDALIEFLPGADVDQMLSAWDDDQNERSEKPKSKWHTGSSTPPVQDQEQ
jgi:hypothetical protein